MMTAHQGGLQPALTGLAGGRTGPFWCNPVYWCCMWWVCHRKNRLMRIAVHLKMLPGSVKEL